MKAKRNNSAPTAPQTPPTSPPTPVVEPFGTAGIVVIAVLVLFLAVWMHFQLPTPVRGAQASPATALSTGGPALAGFRSDAWYLPADERLGFVEVPAGEFPMGSDSTDAMAYDNERWMDGGPGRIDLPAFLIGRYEVTVAQYGAFVAATGYRADEQSLRAPGDHPVTHVSWPDAIAYAAWLDRVLREAPGTPAEIARLLREGWKVQLPTEAQWEKAARGADGRIFPWGDEPRRDRANFGGRSTRPVGSMECPECAFGLSDMSGNVWEWTRTPHQPNRPYGIEAAPDLESDALWTMRGGAFNDVERNVRATVRGAADPGVRRPFIGFRLVLAPG